MEGCWCWNKFIGVLHYKAIVLALVLADWAVHELYD
jgi:hypothetical protein